MARVDGKPKQVWQKYLGTAEKIVELKERAAELPHIKLTSFQYGKTASLLATSNELGFIETVNRHTNKKKVEGLTVGEYFLLNIIRRLPLRSTTLTSPAGDLKTPPGTGVRPSMNRRMSFFEPLVELRSGIRSLHLQNACAKS